MSLKKYQNLKSQAFYNRFNLNIHFIQLIYK